MTYTDELHIFNAGSMLEFKNAFNVAKFTIPINNKGILFGTLSNIMYFC